ncbi:MAG: hypothetical protein K2Y20_05895 [Sphingomonas sp.]|nr:hypothetical protein [Pirellulales bacterium]MBX9859110.1 hypothetical protein [Sphingomonas sp.]
MSKRAAHFTKDDITRAVSGVLAGGLEVGEVRVLRDGSIVLNVGASRTISFEHDDIDARIEAFASK